MKSTTTFMQYRFLGFAIGLTVFVFLCVVNTSLGQEVQNDKLQKLLPETSRITDEILRAALNKLIATAIAHQAPSDGIGPTNEVLDICRASQGVYCQFMGFRAQYPLSAVGSARTTALKAYDLALRKISWIKDRKVENKELNLAFESITDKRTKIENAKGIEEPRYVVANRRR